MNPLLPFIDDLAEMIKAVWTDVANPVFRMTQIQRRNWLDDVEAGEITPPYVVVDIPPLVKSANGPASASVWDVSPTIYYITAEKSGAGNVSDLIESRLSSLSGALTFPAPPLPPFAYTVYDVPTWSTAATEPVNAAMLEKQLPYLSGSLTFTALIGYVRVPG